MGDLMNYKFYLILLLFTSKIVALTISFDYNYPRYLDYYYYDYYYPNWRGYFVKPRVDNKIWKNYRTRNKARCKFYCECQEDYNCDNPEMDKINQEAVDR